MVEDGVSQKACTCIHNIGILQLPGTSHFLRSWYLVIFLISASFSPKSLILTPQSAMPSSLFLYLSMISGRNTLFWMFTLDGIISSYVSGRYFHVFSDYFWFIFPTNFLELGYQSFCRCAADYIIYSVVSLCVQLF